MKKYRVYISDEQGGYILVNSKSSEDALELADELVGEYGCDQLFNPEWNANGCEEDLTKYCGKSKHGEYYIHNAEEIKSE